MWPPLLHVFVFVMICSGNQHICDQMITRTRMSRKIMTYYVSMVAATSVERCVYGCAVRARSGGAVRRTGFTGTDQDSNLHRSWLPCLNSLSEAEWIPVGPILQFTLRSQQKLPKSGLKKTRFHVICLIHIAMKKSDLTDVGSKKQIWAILVAVWTLISKDVLHCHCVYHHAFRQNGNTK